ncbi:hypothetical protein ES703_88881 [subsurface metagenome]
MLQLKTVESFRNYLKFENRGFFINLTSSLLVFKLLFLIGGKEGGEIVIHNYGDYDYNGDNNYYGDY